MIVARSETEPYAVTFTDGKHTGLADAIVADGGREAGFKPFALLEASLATCIAMTIRMYADRHSWALPGLEVRVKLDQSRAAAPVLRYDVDFGSADLTPEIRERLLRVATACPVHKALAKPMSIAHSELVV
ncbi:MAG: OsmC family protein [Hyphomicrobiaceae bacterium]